MSTSRKSIVLRAPKRTPFDKACDQGICDVRLRPPVSPARRLDAIRKLLRTPVESLGGWRIGTNGQFTHEMYVTCGEELFGRIPKGCRGLMDLLPDLERACSKEELDAEIVAMSLRLPGVRLDQIAVDVHFDQFDVRKHAWPQDKQLRRRIQQGHSRKPGQAR